MCVQSSRSHAQHQRPGGRRCPRLAESKLELEARLDAGAREANGALRSNKFLKTPDRARTRDMWTRTGHGELGRARSG
eukprot:4344936-Prymnesium_polylepis.1